MADQTPEQVEENEAAEVAAEAHRTEQDRLLAMSHADDRPAVSEAALAPRNRPTDAEKRIVSPPEQRTADDFTDPAQGLEHAVSDVEYVRRTEGSEAGDKAAEAVLAGDVPPTPSEAVPAEVKGPSAEERATGDVEPQAPAKRGAEKVTRKG